MSLIDNQSEMVKCPKCGMTIHNTSAFCVNCGKMVRSTIKVSSGNSNAIVHPKFGKGTIVEDKGLTVKILFGNGEEKTISKEYLRRNCGFVDITENDGQLDSQRKAGIPRNATVTDNKQSVIRRIRDLDPEDLYESDDLLDYVEDADWSEFEETYDGEDYSNGLL